MWDITGKNHTARSATARAELRISPEGIAAIRSGTAPKGDPIPVAKVAAIQAAKNTPQILPYCHPLPIENVRVDFDVLEDRIIVVATVKANYKTGVEMEALTAASVGALAIYDMMKMVDPHMEIREVVLLEKTGGKSDIHREEAAR